MTSPESIYEAPEPKGESRLYTRAVVYRELYGRDPVAMREQFADEALQDAAMLVGLLGGEDAARAAAVRYLEQVIDEEFNAGHTANALQGLRSRADVGRGERGPGASAPRAKGHVPNSSRHPSPDALSAARRVMLGNAVSILQTYRIRDGRVLGTLRYGELPRLIERGAKEDWLLMKLYQSGQAPADMIVADMVKDELVETLLSQEPDMEELKKFLDHRKELANA